ncbi:MAG: glycosyltransferase [Deferrisomatales bacterium]
MFLVGLGFGEGHNRAALALDRLLTRVRPDVVTDFSDPLEDAAESAWRRRRAVYYALLRLSPRLYHASYRALSRWRWPLERLSRSLRGWLLAKVVDFHPDLVLASHVFPAHAAQDLCRAGGFRAAGVITDLADDAYWNQTRLDHYLVATPALRDRLHAAGTPESSVHVTGLPVDPVFYEQTPPGEARTRLGLDPARFTVLVLGGGAGFGPVRAAAVALAQADLPIQVVAIAGRNPQLRSRLELLKLTARVPLQVVGFTDRMHDYLSAADLVVTKPGGMTVAECLAKGLPMVLLGSPLPGPETLNQAWLVEQGLGRPVRDATELVRFLGHCLPPSNGGGYRRT